jgi:hypothetical protein
MLQRDVAAAKRCVLGHTPRVIAERIERSNAQTLRSVGGIGTYADARTLRFPRGRRHAPSVGSLT